MRAPMRESASAASAMEGVSRVEKTATDPVRRMRYTLVTAGETTEEQAKLLNLLRVSGVETLHVKAG